MNNDAAGIKASLNDDALNPSLPQVQPVTTPSGRGAKENEPSGAAIAAEEAKLMKDILEAAEVQRERDLAPVLKEVKDAKLAHPKVELPPDVEDAGIVEPEEEASKVVTNGPTLNLPISESQYEQGLKTGASGKWHAAEREVVGVKSLLALALWVGRLIKRAHRHTMRVVFKKGAS